MKSSRIVVWLRNDLRLEDNETLVRAIQQGGEVVPVYCLDPRMLEKTSLGLQKTGNYRISFLLESLKDLKASFQELDADLVVLQGKPEDVMLSFAKEIRASAIFFSKEVTAEERAVDREVEKKAFSMGIACESFWQSTLYHKEDLPFPIKQLPEVFTQFRKEVEKQSSPRPPFAKPTQINFPKEVLHTYTTTLPGIQTYGLDHPKAEVHSGFEIRGGESAAWRRLQSYFWEKDLLKRYKETRNGLIGMDYSSKFSPWLALGCISPRTIFTEVKKYEKSRTKNESTYWLVFELIWRDYFRFIAKKHGVKIFQKEGIRNQMDSWRRDKAQFQRWVEGKTGVPFVDANMRELQATGFMSNRGRQLVASFLVNDLGIDWTWGASYFESQLIDYDPCSNWGNWMYVGGVGNDPRENRYFNILRQAKTYDRNGDFVRLWIPELRSIAGFDVHQPWEVRSFTFQNYPRPMVALIGTETVY
ncbi:MAG: hypothetical protein RL407_2092 [Bacteroidota bacterium]|jgi:deoxyribodipyrimidine photo-lyase